jgi:predicted Mrr-cat superfamily restriction endonuclease
MSQVEQNHLGKSGIWLVRAGRDVAYVDCFLVEKVVAVGGGEIPITVSEPDDDIRKRFKTEFVDMKKGTPTRWANELIAFVKEMRIGDTVATYVPHKHLYHVGVVLSCAEHTGTIANKDKVPGHSRRVEWKYQLCRDVLSFSTRKELAIRKTIFRLSSTASDEFANILLGDDL